MMSKQFFLLGNIQPGKSFGALNPNSVFADSDNLLDQDFPCLTLGGLRFEIRNIGTCIDITEGSREQICRPVWRAVVIEAQCRNHVVQ